MDNEAITYQLSYHKLEQELMDLSYNVHLCNDQLGVYSTHIADMILRACMDIEATSKLICRLRDPNKHSKHHKFDYDCINALSLQKECTLLVMPAQTITKDDLRICFPFCKDVSKDRPNTTSAKQANDYRWNNAYQNLKHNKTESLERCASLENLLFALSAVFILNCYLSNKGDIPSDIFCKISYPNGRYCRPTIRTARICTLSGKEKDYYDNRIASLEESKNKGHRRRQR